MRHPRTHNGRRAPMANRKVTQRETRRIVGRMNQVVGASRKVVSSLESFAFYFGQVQAHMRVIEDDVTKRLALTGTIARFDQSPVDRSI